MVYSLEELTRVQNEKENKSVENGFHVIYSTGGDKKPLPKVGKKYFAYDDGKLSPSREYRVEILQVSNYEALSDEVKELWQENVIQGYWLYAPESDWFIKAINEDNVVEWFVRTKDGGWFSFSDHLLTYGRLDVTGELHKKVHEGY